MHCVRYRLALPLSLLAASGCASLVNDVGVNDIDVNDVGVNGSRSVRARPSSSLPRCAYLQALAHGVWHGDVWRSVDCDDTNTAPANYSDPVRVFSDSTEPISGHQKSSDAISGHQKATEAISGHQKPLEAITGHEKATEEVIRGNQLRWMRVIGDSVTRSLNFEALFTQVY